MSLIFLGVLLLLVATLWATARLILYPTLAAAQRVRGSFRFHLVDSMWLSVQIQIALAAIVAWVPRTYREFFFAVTLFGVLGTTALWAGAVQFLSSAGIVGTRKRGIFVLVYLPCTLLVMMLPAGALLGAVNLYVNSPFNARWLIIGGTAALIIPFAGLVYGLRQLGWWLVGEDMAPLPSLQLPASSGYADYAEAPTG